METKDTKIRILEEQVRVPLTCLLGILASVLVCVLTYPILDKAKIIRFSNINAMHSPPRKDRLYFDTCEICKSAKHLST